MNFTHDDDVREFAARLAEYEAGAIDEDTWKHARLRYGVYGQRQGGDWQMVRVKVPAGGLRPAQLHRVAELTETIGRGVAHVTTRQDLQVHWIPRARVVEFLARLAEIGLTSREACGNSVRNVTACPLAGIHPRERFDVTPYALATAKHFLRHEVTQSLPRKFKIAFEACPESCTGPGFHDIGAVGVIERGRRGFRLWVGGGLGNTPRPATLLEEFTPEDELLRTQEAIVRVFDSVGNRKNRNRARLKFVFDHMSWDEFRRRVFETRESLPQAPITAEAFEAAAEEAPEPAKVEREIPVFDPAYSAWRRANVVGQRQAGYSAVQVLLPIGDVGSTQLHALAKLSALYGEGRVRTTQRQNVLLRWVRDENLPAVYRRLKELGLAEPGAEGIADITACPGAATCSLAFTASKGLAGAIRETIAKLNGHRAAVEGLSVKISGCPNSCGQHHIADVGFYGSTKRVGEVELPAYNVLVGGSARDGRVDFGLQVARVPANKAPAAFRAVVEAYVEGRREGEAFFDFARRLGGPWFEALLRPYEEADDGSRLDWGQRAQFAREGAMVGECAS